MSWLSKRRERADFAALDQALSVPIPLPSSGICYVRIDSWDAWDQPMAGLPFDARTTRQILSGLDLGVMHRVEWHADADGKLTINTYRAAS